MGFKDKLIKKIPSSYILHKAKNRSEAHEIIKGYKAIRKNNLFDDEFYLNSYRKVKEAKMDPLLHYIFFGFEEGKKPFADFDGSFYINHYGIKGNPLIHYALHGKAKGYSYKIENIDLATFKDENKKSILFILHEKITNIGGTGFTSLDIIKSIGDSFNKFILTSDGVEVDLWSYEDKLEKIAHWSVSYNSDFSLVDVEKNKQIVASEFENYIFNEQLASIYEEILLKLDIDLIHINHLINHSFDLIEIAKKIQVPYLLTVHDFYYCCPSIHLLDENFSFCNLNCYENCGINIDKSDKIPDVVKIWQKHCLDLLNGAYLNIFPSQSCLDIYHHFYKDLDNVCIIEHGRDLVISQNQPKLATGKIKVLVPGHISQHKGSLLIPEIKKLDLDNKIEFHFVGTTIPNLKEYGVSHGRYNRDEFNEIVDTIKPSFIAILSVCPETYSHTLTESLAAGVPVIATDLGALKERIEKYDVGWLVKANPQEIYDKIIGIENAEYMGKVFNISKIQFKSLYDMIIDYVQIYDKVCGKNG